MDEIERRSKLTLSVEDPVLVRFVLPDIEGSVVSGFPLIVRFRPLPSSDARSVGKRSMANDGDRLDRSERMLERSRNFCPWMYELVASTTAKVSTTTIAYVWYGFYWESKAFR